MECIHCARISHGTKHRRALTKLGSASRRAAAPWLCGYVREADCHRYSAHNFYGEIKRYFRWLGGMPRAPSEKHST